LGIQSGKWWGQDAVDVVGLLDGLGNFLYQLQSFFNSLASPDNSHPYLRGVLQPRQAIRTICSQTRSRIDARISSGKEKLRFWKLQAVETVGGTG
jgi:hypothetical protein